MNLPTNCIICSGDAASGFWGPPDAPEKQVPVCSQCYESGAFQTWFDAAVKDIEAFAERFAIESSGYTGNIYLDLMMVRAHLIHESRLEDGVCPNGCARLNDLGGGDFQCPVCNFVLHQRTL